MTPREPGIYLYIFAQDAQRRTVQILRSDEEQGLGSTANKYSTTKSESPSPPNATSSPHQNALVDDTSTAAQDRRIAIASVWQVLQLYLVHRMGALAARHTRET